jgi:hypothetical protein
MDGLEIEWKGVRGVVANGKPTIGICVIDVGFSEPRIGRILDVARRLLGDRRLVGITNGGWVRRCVGFLGWQLEIRQSPNGK